MANGNQRTDDGNVIYVKSFWHKGARKRLYAASYGKDAFRIVIRDKSTPKKAS